VSFFTGIRDRATIITDYAAEPKNAVAHQKWSYELFERTYYGDIHSVWNDEKEMQRVFNLLKHNVTKFPSIQQWDGTHFEQPQLWPGFERALTSK